MRRTRKESREIRKAIRADERLYSDISAWLHKLGRKPMRAVWYLWFPANFHAGLQSSFSPLVYERLFECPKPECWECAQPFQLPLEMMLVARDLQQTNEILQFNFRSRQGATWALKDVYQAMQGSDIEIAMNDRLSTTTKQIIIPTLSKFQLR